MRRVTLKQVATQAGVSYQTVSKVLNKQVRVSQETEARIWQAARELHYRPNLVARSLRSRRSRLIGYSWEPASADQANPILDRFLQSMAQSAEHAGYHLLAFPYHPGQAWIESYRALIETNRVDAFVISSVEYNDPRILLLQEQGFPFVAFGRSDPGWDFPYVDVDGAAGMRLVVEHLVERGHRRIAVLAWPESSRVGQNRMDGLLASLESAGIELPGEYLARGEGTFALGMNMTHCWLDLPTGRRPTALIAFNDVMAIGAMHASQLRDLEVGVDIAVTGFDDTPMIQYLKPGLTSIRQPVWEVGETVMSVLLNTLDKAASTEAGPRHVLLKPQLIIRQSSSAVFG